MKKIEFYTAERKKRVSLTGCPAFFYKKKRKERNKY